MTFNEWYFYGQCEIIVDDPEEYESIWIIAQREKEKEIKELGEQK